MQETTLKVQTARVGVSQLDLGSIILTVPPNWFPSLRHLSLHTINTIRRLTKPRFDATVQTANHCLCAWNWN